VIFHGYVSHNQMVLFSMAGVGCLWMFVVWMGLRKKLGVPHAPGQSGQSRGCH